MEKTHDYPPPKRRRTSSHGSTSSRNSSQSDRDVRLPISHGKSAQAQREGRETNQSRKYSMTEAGDGNYDSEKDQAAKGHSRYRRSESRSRSRSSRRRRSETASSDYATPPDRPQFDAERRSGSYSPRMMDEDIEAEQQHPFSRSVSPDAGQSSKVDQSNTQQPDAKPKSKSLNFTLLTAISRAHARGITSVKFSPDGSLLATASADASIHIYSVPSDLSSNTGFKLLRTLDAHLAGINALAWSPIGPPYTLASASDDKSILLWSPLASDFPISPSPLTGHHNYVYSLAFSPKGNMLVSGSYDEAVFLWDVRSARVMRSLPAHSDPVRGVDFLRDGTMVASCAGDGLIRIWDASTGQCLRTLVDEDRKPVTSVRFSPNGKYILAWTLDDCVRLWRYVEGACVKTYQGHVNSEFSLSGAVGTYNSGRSGNEAVDRRHMVEGAFLVSGSEDGDLLAWDVTSKELLWRAPRAHEDVVLAIDYLLHQSPDGDQVPRAMLASAGKDRDVKIWIEDVVVPKGAGQHGRGENQDNEGEDPGMLERQEGDTAMEMRDGDRDVDMLDS